MISNLAFRFILILMIASSRCFVVLILIDLMCNHPRCWMYLIPDQMVPWCLVIQIQIISDRGHIPDASTRSPPLSNMLFLKAMASNENQIKAMLVTNNKPLLYTFVHRVHDGPSKVDRRAENWWSGRFNYPGKTWLSPSPLKHIYSNLDKYV